MNLGTERSGPMARRPWWRMKTGVSHGKGRVVAHQNQARRLRSRGFSVAQTPHTTVAVAMQNGPSECIGHEVPCRRVFLKSLKRTWGEF